MFFLSVLAQVPYNAHSTQHFLFLGLPEHIGHAGLGTGKAGALRLVLVTAAFFLCRRGGGKSPAADPPREGPGSRRCSCTGRPAQASGRARSWPGHRHSGSSGRGRAFQSRGRPGSEPELAALCRQRRCSGRTAATDTQTGSGPQAATKRGSSYATRSKE